MIDNTYKTMLKWINSSSNRLGSGNSHIRLNPSEHSRITGYLAKCKVDGTLIVIIRALHCRSLAYRMAGIKESQTAAQRDLLRLLDTVVT
jgi:hypothetical protein